MASSEHPDVVSDEILTAYRALDGDLAKCLVLCHLLKEKKVLVDSEVTKVKFYLFQRADNGATYNYLTRAFERTLSLEKIRHELSGFMGDPDLGKRQFSRVSF